MSAVAGILAHQGGWDEALPYVLPVVAFVGLLWLADRRARSAPADDVREAAVPQKPGPDGESDDGESHDGGDGCVT